MCYRSVAYLRSKVSTVCFEEVTGELRTVVCDDAVRHPEPAHDAPDELDRGTRGDGADGLYFIPLGELVHGDVEVAVAPGARGNGPRMSSPQTANGHERGIVCRPPAS